MKEIIDFIRTVESLKRVKRAGWVREGVPDPESVADHSFGVSVLCHLLADNLNVDKEKLIKMALVHDLAEVEVGDQVLQRGSQTLASRKKRFEQEKEFLEKLFSRIPDKNEYLNFWLEFEEQKTREAIICKQLDKLETAFQALEYEKDVEPSKLDEFFVNTRMHLKEPILIKMFDEMEKQRKKK